jgi:RNA polymerase sigma-70 factor, ECF subfamily
MNPVPETDESQASLDFEMLVERFYKVLYQFAFSLTRSEADACDLTQQTFFIWAEKGDQLRDRSKVKTWLFTSLHRAFLQCRRRQSRFPHCEIGAVDAELPPVPPPQINHCDASQVLASLRQLDEIYQAPIALFYLDDCPYKEIAEMLNVPLGTVKSRIARGIAQLQQILAGNTVPQTRRKMPVLRTFSVMNSQAGLCELHDSRFLKLAA